MAAEIPIPARFSYLPADRIDAEPLGSRVRQALTEIASAYPEALREAQLRDVDRMAFCLEQVAHPGASIADLGGGIGLFSLGAAALGMESWLIDDFKDPVNSEFPLAQLDLHAKLGVRAIETGVRDWGASFADESLDVVASIESLEHWHHSPRPTFREAFRTLRPGGLLFLGAPNAVNLRKRVGVVFGRSNWSSFDEWYGSDLFRGHVREPVLADLLRIVDDLGFETQRVWGRNWCLYRGRRLADGAAALVDRMLRPVPTLCSDLFVLARKPA